MSRFLTGELENYSTFSTFPRKLMCLLLNQNEVSMFSLLTGGILVTVMKIQVDYIFSWKIQMLIIMDCSFEASLNCFFFFKTCLKLYFYVIFL